MQDFSFAFSDEVIYTVTLIVIDNSGAEANEQIMVTVQNVPVFPIALPNQKLSLDDEISVTSGFFDPGNDFWTVAVHPRDGTSLPLIVDQATKTFQAQHTYTLAGQFVVNVMIDDQDDGAATTSFVTTILTPAQIVGRHILL